MVNLYQRERYVQTLFGYLSGLEQAIRSQLGENTIGIAFTREGDYYTRSQPRYVRTVKLFYMLLLGMLLVAFLFSRIWYDVTLAGWSFLVIADVGISAVILFFFYAYVRSSEP